MKTNQENKLLGGVCAGIADASGIDVVIVRLLVVLGTFSTGIVPGLIIYAVAAILMQ